MKKTAQRKFWNTAFIWGILLIPWSLAVQGLQVEWTDPSADVVMLPDDANNKTFVASVKCADHAVHTYDVKCYIFWNDDDGTLHMAKGSSSWDSQYDFLIDCRWSGFVPGIHYELDIKVTETDTGAWAKDTIHILTPERWVVVDWNAHPGAKIVLNNGELTDYFWGDENGVDWPLFFKDCSEWTETGANVKRESVQTYWDDFDPAVDNPGDTTVSLSYYFSDGSAAFGHYNFCVREEEKATEIAPNPGNPIPYRIYEDGMRVFLGQVLNPESANYPITGSVSVQSSNSYTIGIAVSERVSKTSGTTVSSGSAVQGAINVGIDIISLTIGQNWSWGLSMMEEKTVEKALNKSLERSYSDSVEVTTNSSPIEPGKRVDFFSYSCVNETTVELRKYPDSNPRDAFPDSQEQQGCVIYREPVGMGVYATPPHP